MSSEDKGKMSPHRDRYWSVMLVGDHGRVIPFRHFKGLAIAICVGFVLMLIALVVMGILYTHQMKKMDSLQSRISEIQLQNTKLRDEKDLYLTKLMLKENRRSGKINKMGPTLPAEPSPADKSGTNDDSNPLAQTPDNITTDKKAADQKIEDKKAGDKKQSPSIKWMADIRNFSVNYDASQEILKAQFRIYNLSKPKKPLSGRSVIVFKNVDDPPGKWLTVPQLTLKDGVPPSDKGQAFQIRNYFTMRFRSYRQKAPIKYDAITAYVFSTDGQLLASKDIAINIDVPLPEKKQSQEPLPAPETRPQPPVDRENGSKVEKPKEEQAPTRAPARENSGSGAGKEPVKPEAAPGQTKPPMEKNETSPGQPPEKPADGAPDSSMPVNTPEPSAPKEPLPNPQPPGTEPKP